MTAVAGSVSTCLFMISVLPMLIKAWRTHDLASYSLGNLAIEQSGQRHPLGVRVQPARRPDLAAARFYLAATALMLIWMRFGITSHAARQHLPDRSHLA